jgi:hypothetical protein
MLEVKTPSGVFPTEGGPMTTATPTCSTAMTWHLQRILFLVAGLVTLTGVALGAFVSPWFLLIPTMVGVNQLLMVAVGWCPMSLLLKRIGVPEA